MFVWCAPNRQTVVGRALTTFRVTFIDLSRPPRVHFAFAVHCGLCPLSHLEGPICPLCPLTFFFILFFHFLFLPSVTLLFRCPQSSLLVSATIVVTQPTLTKQDLFAVIQFPFTVISALDYHQVHDHSICRIHISLSLFLPVLPNTVTSVVPLTFAYSSYLISV